MRPSIYLLVLLPCLLPSILPVHADQVEPANTDESLVPEYVLPDPLAMENGTAVERPADWPVRREEILHLFQRHLYGRPPMATVSASSRILWEKAGALSGLADMKEVELELSRGDKSVSLVLLVVTPAGSMDPVPAFVGLNFHGNHTVSAEQEVRVTRSWVRDSNKSGATDNRASEEGRGSSSSRWPLEQVVQAGCAVVTVYCGDIDPDHVGGGKDGVQSLFTEADFDVPAEERWGTIAAWAWGLSRVLDYMESDDRLDAGRAVAIGHSRLGKTALWAGASDPRFAAAISNDSGCAGAALFRRRFGERLDLLNRNFPHWLNRRSRDYENREARLPVDQHQLVALMAPRPVYVASASQDLWADPKGEFLSLVHARPVYELLGVSTFADQPPPQPGKVLSGPLNYHVREGRHDITAEDWAHYIDFVLSEVSPAQ